MKCDNDCFSVCFMARSELAGRLEVGEKPPGVCEPDQLRKTPGLSPGDCRTERAQLVIVPALVIECRVGTPFHLHDQAIDEQTMQRPVQSGRSQEKAALGHASNLLHDVVAMSFTLGKGEQNVESG